MRTPNNNRQRIAQNNRGGAVPRVEEHRRISDEELEHARKIISRNEFSIHHEKSIRENNLTGPSQQ